MNELANFWNIIVESNTFNFAVLLIIFAVLYKKMNVADGIEKIKQGIINSINSAKEEQKCAKNKLKDAKKSIENIDSDIAKQLEDAVQRGEGLANQILANTEEKVRLIEKNVKRVINAEEKTLSAKMTEKILNASIELAKKHIISTLENNQDLHNKFIDESIENIDRM